jgi:hypothetical protein
VKSIQVNHDGELGKRGRKRERERERNIWGEGESNTAVRENGVG